MTETATPLVSPDVYERHAVHIGTNQKSADMKQFLDTMHQDSSGLHIIDVTRQMRGFAWSPSSSPTTNQAGS